MVFNEKEIIQSLLETGNYSIINESNGKMIRDVGNGVEYYEQYYNNTPTKTFTGDKAFNKAYKLFDED